MSPATSGTEAREEDRLARHAATHEFERPLVLEAGAGTGKTTTLVARIAVWSLGPGWQRAEMELAGTQRSHGPWEPADVAARVLAGVTAITFTEAAAAEMGSRVGQAFALVAKGGLPRQVEPADVPPEAARMERARQLSASIDRLQVRTIHAWCRRILAAFPLEAGLAPGFEVDAEGLRVAEVAHEVLAEEFARFYGAGGEPSDPHISFLAARGIGPARIERELVHFLSRAARPEDLAADPLDPEAWNALMEGLCAAIDGFMGGPGARLAGLPAKQEKAIECVAALTQVLAVRSELMLATPIESDLAVETSSEISARVARLRELLEGILDRLEKWGRGEFTKGEKAAFAAISGLAGRGARELRRRAQAIIELDPELLRHGHGLIAVLVARVRAELLRRGVVTFDDLLREAAALLEREPGVAESLRGEIRQLLVDEFQDTDRLQCSIIARIAFEGAGERPGLFLVGDPKQSIYGWRSADLGAYEDFQSRVRARGGEVHRLVVNHRSAAPILDEVRRVIGPVMEYEAGLQPRFEALLPGIDGQGESGFAKGEWRPVEHWITWDFDRASATFERNPGSAGGIALEARLVAEDLVRLSETGVAWKSIALLFRAATRMEDVLAELRERDIPYQVSGDRNYYRRREVIDAAACLRTILDPTDTLALVAWLRSGLVGVPDAALAPLWARGLPRLLGNLLGRDPGEMSEIEEAVRGAARALPPGVPGLERLEGWEEALLDSLAALGELRAAFQSEAPDRFIEHLRLRMLGPALESARPLGAYRLANLERFERQLLRSLVDRRGDVRAVLRQLELRMRETRSEEGGRPKSAVEDAVQVSTVHKAKGLEFQHVYLLQMHSRPNKSSSGDEPFFEIRDGRASFRLFGQANLALALRQEEQRRLEAAERVRTLYVAMTRASDRLVLVGRPAKKELDPEGHEAGSFADLLARREGERADLSKLGDAAERDPEACFADAGGARWILPAVRPAPSHADRVSGGSDQGEPPSIAEIARQSAHLAELSLIARERMLRPWIRAASAESHEVLAARFERGGERRSELHEASDDRRAAHDGLAAGESRTLATAIGTLVHRFLEGLDLASDPLAALAGLRGELPRHLEPLVPLELREKARTRALAVLGRLERSGFLERLAGLGERVIARELPVLLPPEDGPGAPVGCIAGAIDLLYRDPLDGALVIADYKTDEIEGEDALMERAEVYRPQGASYLRGLCSALGLDAEPRFELWFVHPGRIVRM